MIGSQAAGSEVGLVKPGHGICTEGVGRLSVRECMLPCICRMGGLDRRAMLSGSGCVHKVILLLLVLHGATDSLLSND